MLSIITRLKVPNVILRYIMMNFLDVKSIEVLLLTVPRMNVLDSYSKDLLMKSKKGFIWNCENGHMDVAKWLVSLGGVNIHACNEGAFRYSCRNGHIDVAKWLLEIGSDSLPSQPALSGTRVSLGGVNIHADDEGAFRWSCENGHMDVAKWLFSIGANIPKNIYYGNDDIRAWIYSFKN